MIRMAMPASQEALLGPNAQRLEVGLLCARTAAVLRRIIDGEATDGIDIGVLNSAADMMTTAAEAIEVVAGGGRLRRDRSSLGFGAMAFAAQLAAPSTQPGDLPEALLAMANALRTLEAGADLELAQRVLPAFSMLADVATRQAGAVGEGGGSLI
jgi:hypothetical protein